MVPVVTRTILAAVTGPEDRSAHISPGRAAGPESTQDSGTGRKFDGSVGGRREDARMTLLPITVPASLLSPPPPRPRERDWGVRVDHAVATAAGETYVLSGLRRYRGHAVGSADPAEQNFGYQPITRYGTDETPTVSAVFGQAVPGGALSAVPEGDGATLAVLPDGQGRPQFPARQQAPALPGP